ncbi:restriction endonuclease subunit S [Aliivibrio fischeri]|uniref:restriction endonuclease subunit S n=1 Tax=Aliivibrio fischeri TaxID=668 RepID=UPI0012DADE4D|nr:restriction endonuclease subunit S [Aliivibrio fischeri]MUK65241.1 restriction endonuclease subunit S [Aliivibrio fischeri]
MSVERLITDNIDVWTSTVKTKSASGRGSSKKIELYGIKKLRELILELAVRGKLVPQDPNDEPASVLLERIAEEKAQLVKEKKIKKPKELAKISEKEIPYILPKGWVWSRLGDLVDVSSSKRVHARDYVQTGIPFFRSKEIGELYRGEEISTDLYITLEQYNELKELPGAPKLNDILLTSVGSIGNSWICDGRAFYYKDGNITKLGSSDLLSMFYLKNFISSPIFTSQVIDKVSGTAYSALTIVKLNNLLVPIQSLNEQNRIVAKVDELMLLCDQLEQQTETSIEAHQTLVEVLLNTLTSSADAQELMQNWQRISEHFDALFTTENSIDTLKQTILQLAVMGKLVPQDPNDEPAAKLLERIAEEKAQLIKDKKIKKQKVLPEISEDEKPFDLPSGWEWCRFGQVFIDLKYGTSKKSDYKTVGTPVLRIPNIVGGKVDLNDIKYSVMSDKELFEYKLNKGDLLLIRSNGSLGIVGRSAVVDIELENTVYAGYLVRARIVPDSVNSNYLKSTLDSLDVRRQIEGPIRSTSGVKNVNSTELSNLLIPLAPKSEQERINKKVADFHLVCDQLKARLKESQTTQLHLTDAIIDKAL